MKCYSEMNKEELMSEKNALEAKYKDFKSAGLKLDMSRGKPGVEQV